MTGVIHATGDGGNPVVPIGTLTMESPRDLVKGWAEAYIPTVWSSVAT